MIKMKRAGEERGAERSGGSGVERSRVAEQSRGEVEYLAMY
jgi:hypothetical protein